VDKFDGLLASSPFTLGNTDWSKNSALVYGFGDFEPKNTIAKTDFSIKNDKFTIGYVGMPSYKRLPLNAMDYFAEAIRLIPNVRFVMAGEVSDEFRRDIEKNGFEQYFDLLGWVSDIPALLQTFDVFGYLMRPDTSATTENSVLEAMAAGVPCVISKHPIGKYLLEDKVSGFLADNPKEYGQLLSTLYTDSGLRKQIGEAGREYAINNYCTDDNMKRFNDACKAVLCVPKYVRKFRLKRKVSND
jgi:glycosyltransferase involved in cell wall biosynthesis